MELVTCDYIIGTLAAACVALFGWLMRSQRARIRDAHLAANITERMAGGAPSKGATTLRLERRRLEDALRKLDSAGDAEEEITEFGAGR